MEAEFLGILQQPGRFRWPLVTRWLKILCKGQRRFLEEFIARESSCPYLFINGALSRLGITNHASLYVEATQGRGAIEIIPDAGVCRDGDLDVLPLLHTCMNVCMCAHVCTDGGLNAFSYVCLDAWFCRPLIEGFMECA